VHGRARPYRPALVLIDQYVAAGSQFVVTTHSPILLALPGTKILEIDQDGSIHSVDYDSSRTVSAMRGFLESPNCADVVCSPTTERRPPRRPGGTARARRESQF
jgi:hypothetical protein